MLMIMSVITDEIETMANKHLFGIPGNSHLALLEGGEGKHSFCNWRLENLFDEVIGQFTLGSKRGWPRSQRLLGLLSTR